ncbi:serine hydrolase [Hyphomicrobium sp.]|uniref:serine hydrolase n=1 Tax=Hyphomicrobium sp. TaxID=82 RepID=UPI002FDCCFCD
MAIAVIRSMVLAFAACAVAVTAHPQAALAQQAKSKQKQAAAPKQAAFVIDANTGKALHAQAADEPRFPASLTKMMTLYMVFGEIERGRLTFQSRIRFSVRATGVAPSKLGLKVGEEITVLNAVKALVVKSANDVAVAVAEHIGGTEHQFARMMTERARQIGMKSTTFRNASGLPEPSQHSTARDMVTLALRLQDDFPQHYHLFSTVSFAHGGKTYRTHNTLMLAFPGMDGIKTGYTRASGFNLVSSVRAGGKHVVGAVFGGKTAATRNAHMRSLLFAALEKASTTRTRQGGPMLVAEARAASPPRAQARIDATWASATQTPSRPEKVQAAARPAAQAPSPISAPIPVPVRSAKKQLEPAPRHDAIAAVLAEGDESPAESDEAWPPSPAVTAPRLDLEGLRQAISENGDAHPHPGAALTGSLGTPGAGTQSEQFGRMRETIVEGTPGPATRVRAPSTLNQQATALAALAEPSEPQPRAAPPPHAATQVAALAPAAHTGPGYEVQIGAYRSADEAQARLETVRARAASLLEGHQGVTLAVERNNGRLFRARFVGFDERAASNTCLELRRIAVDCFVMRAD